MLTKWRNWGVCTVDHYVCIHVCQIIIIILYSRTTIMDSLRYNVNNG